MVGDVGAAVGIDLQRRRVAGQPVGCRRGDDLADPARGAAPQVNQPLLGAIDQVRPAVGGEGDDTGAGWPRAGGDGLRLPRCAVVAGQGQRLAAVGVAGGRAAGVVEGQRCVEDEVVERLQR